MEVNRIIKYALSSDIRSLKLLSVYTFSSLCIRSQFCLDQKPKNDCSVLGQAKQCKLNQRPKTYYFGQLLSTKQWNICSAKREKRKQEHMQRIDIWWLARDILAKMDELVYFTNVFSAFLHFS